MQEDATSLLQSLKYLKNNPLKRKHNKQKKRWRGKYTKYKGQKKIRGKTSKPVSNHKK